MSPEERQQFQDHIQHQIEAVTAEILELEERTKPIAPDCAIGRVSRMDAINNRSINEAALRTARQKRAQLENTLVRVSDADFGICVRCGHAIPPARLMFMPQTTRCVSCANR